MDIQKMPKTAEDFTCETCAFKCSKKSNYEKHIATPKHQNKVKGYNNDIKKEQKMLSNQDECICECGKKYNYYSGLWRHKKNVLHPQ